MSFRPIAAGALRDRREGTNLARDSSFFASAAEARRFVAVGIAPLVRTLPPRPRCADFGGGQGVLGLAIQEGLRAAGLDPEVTVVDANEAYLADARRAGLATLLENIQEHTTTDLDLATMRLVNQYNDRVQQAAMLAAVRQALRPGAPFVSQIETGTPLVCALHTAVAKLLARDRGGPTGYWWPTLPQYVRLLGRAGFSDVVVRAGAAVVDWPLHSALEYAWHRFNASRAAAGVRSTAGWQEARARVLAQARDLIDRKVTAAGRAGAELAGGVARLAYPVIVCQRPGQRLTSVTAGGRRFPRP
jgi:hypothetical protein